MAIFSIGKHHTGGEGFLGKMNMPAAKKQRRQLALDNAELGMNTEYVYLSGAHE